MKPKRTCLIIFFLIIFGMGSLSCTRSEVDNQSPAKSASGIFRHRWWNYYTRAVTSADDGNHIDAKVDLQHALEQRDGDQRMARTYGMHFIDYFPHRELGILYWLEGNLADAQMELEQSIAQYPSAKAHFYLDQVRRRQIRQRGGQVAPPVVELDLSNQPIWTRESLISVAGRVDDPNFVCAVSINDKNLPLEGAVRQFVFKHSLKLPHGRHQISVSAENLGSVSGQVSFTVNVDQLGPIIVVDHVTMDQGGLLIEGAVLDAAGVLDVSINGKPLPVNGPVTKVTFKRHVAAGQVTDIICHDRLHNERRVRFATDRWLDSGAGRRLVAGLTVAGLFSGRDKTPPLIQIDDWDDTVPHDVYLEKILFSGMVRDDDQVTSLRINGRSVLPRTGVLLFFNDIVELEPGENIIAIEVADAAGNTSTRTIRVNRKIPRSMMLDQRLRISVFPFDHKGEGAEVGLGFQDQFLFQMIQPRRFQLVERDKLDLILQEQHLGHAGLIDTSTAVRLGRLAAAHAVVTGAIIETHTGIEVIGRVIDSDTAVILCALDVYGEDKSAEGRRKLAQWLSLKIHHQFPLVDGAIVNREGDVIYTDLGAQELRAQRRILVYKERPIHGAGNQILGMDQQIMGHAWITQVQEQLSKAELGSDCDQTICSLHHVIAQ